MMVSVSVPPASIWLSGGYLNWKPKVEFVKVSQSPGMGIGLAVIVGVGGVSGVDVKVGDGGGSAGVGVNVGVGVSPRTLRLPGTDSIAVSTLSPLETRA